MGKRKAQAPQNRGKTGAKLLDGGVDPGVGKGTQFKPGVSGNPSGRPRTALLAAACREWLLSPSTDDPQRTNAQALAAKLGSLALTGDIRAAEALADRAEGRPRQSIELEATEIRQAFERMTREELARYASEARLPTWFPQGGQTHDESTSEQIH